MKKLSLFILTVGILTTSFGQTLETVYLNPKDSSSNMFVAVKPDNLPVKAFMFCLPGAFQTPQYVLQQTNLPMYAAKQGILTIIPVFATGLSSKAVFGIDPLLDYERLYNSAVRIMRLSVNV
jgi:hypothetical protein